MELKSGDESAVFCSFAVGDGARDGGAGSLRGRSEEGSGDVSADH